MLPSFTYVRPASVPEAIRELSAAGARVHAGGTDLLGCLRDGVFTASKLVAIGGIAELKGIAEERGGLRIGALTTLTEIAGHPVVTQRYAALAQGAAAAASPQLRNQGTLGGNLCQRPRCWYFRGDFACFRKGGEKCFAPEGENEYHCILGGAGCYIVHPSDAAPALVALDASVHIAGPKGPRTVPVESFFLPPSEDISRETALEPGEILTGVTLPPPAANLRSRYRKVRVRGSWDFALVSAAIAVRATQGKVDSIRIALGGVAPTPWRAADAEKALVGKRLNAATISAAATAAVKGAEPLSQNGYKVDMVRGALEEELTALAS